ncbi:MAG: esterase-like activity of phytase family protein [Hydrogenophilaceae bacterium]|nr:esterase-like activity of phytase family protein [Hydrogenophilaceae bacterium]
MITTRPVDLDPRRPGQRRVGRLIFRGGVSMTADVPELGGLSGLYVGVDGRFLAVSDHASWIEARLVSDPRTAAPLRFENARVAGLRDENAERFYETGLGDAEALARLPDGRFAVSYERTQLIRYHALDADGPFGRSVHGPALAEADDLEPNAGLEALAYAGDGRLFVGAERGEGGAMMWLAPVNADAAAAHVARLRAPVGYGLTGADRLPSGDFVLLQRFYAPVVGVRIRILRLDGEALARGEVEAELLATLAPPLNLDNFESVSAIPTVDGGARLYLISDDNFSRTQRTLLYVFDLPPEE